MLRNDSGGCARAVWYERFQRWTKSVAPWWAASIAAHLAIFIVLALVLGTVHVATEMFDRVEFDTVVDQLPPADAPPIEPLKLVEQIEQPPEFNVDVPPVGIGDIKEAPEISDAAPEAAPGRSGLANLDPSNMLDLITVRNVAPQTGGICRIPPPDPSGAPGLVVGPRPPPGGGGGGGDGKTKYTDIALWFALDWIARHRELDGHWSLDYVQTCKDSTCTGAGRVKSDTAATAFKLLPFLGAGQRHDQPCKYQKEVLGGVAWLIQHQADDGNLAAGNAQPMYSHGLAAICLCESFGMTKDRRVGAAAQQAIRFIEKAQNTDDGGWRYKPGDPGDTSVFGWQLMALKSGEMAGLPVSPSANALTKKYLKSVSGGQHGGRYGYMPGQPGGTPAMTAVGMLCSQYSGAKRTDPAMIEGMNFLLTNLPAKQRRDCYFWYYATQAMHNMTGPEWDTWNRAMRRVLVETQAKEGCAAGSWDPAKPVQDHWGEQGGRLMVTSLAALTLEVYYRYLPLYKLDKVEE